MSDKTQLLSLDLDTIPSILTYGKGNMMKEACVWCLDKNNHTSGVKLYCKYTEKNDKFSIAWSIDQIDIDRINKAYNSDDAVEAGAEAVSILLVLHYHPGHQLERSIRGTGFDYMLVMENHDNNNIFNNNVGRLEISGILKEDDNNTLEARTKKKLKQTQLSDKMDIPAIVCVVSFSQPKATVVVRDANS